MKWMLVILVGWIGAAPLKVVQIPVASEALCEAAKHKAGTELRHQVVSSDGGAATSAQRKGIALSPSRPVDVLATCLQVSN